MKTVSTRMKTVSTRMKNVLNAYGISINNATAICKDINPSDTSPSDTSPSDISPSALKAWVSGNRVPSIDGILSFATAFAVSIDWLVGINDSPYTESIVQFAEDEFGLMTPKTGGYNVFRELFVNTSLYNGDFIGDRRILENALAYDDAVQRAQVFSLEARANALVCQRLLSITKDLIEENTERPLVSARLGTKKQGIVNALKIIALTGQPAFFVKKQ